MLTAFDKWKFTILDHSPCNNCHTGECESCTEVEEDEKPVRTDIDF